MVPVLQLADTLWVEAVCPGPTQPLLELEQLGVFLSICPLPQPLCLGLFGTLPGLLPCPAISLAIWFPNSVVPLRGSVATADLGLTLPQASLFLLSTMWAVIMSWE